MDVDVDRIRRLRVPTGPVEYGVRRDTLGKAERVLDRLELVRSEDVDRFAQLGVRHEQTNCEKCKKYVAIVLLHLKKKVEAGGGGRK